MKQVKITVISACCRSEHHKAGEEYIVGDICPPICAELWHRAYPYVLALQNGALLDCGEGKSRSFTVSCPDENRVTLRGETIE